MKYIDLTHIITNDMPVFPGDVSVELKSICNYKDNGVSNHLISSSLHAGTHIDAPGHLSSNDKKIIDFDISKFIGKSVFINAKNLKNINKEAVIGKIKKNDIVLFYTGFDKYFYDEVYFYKYPVIDIGCAQYLVANEIKMIGIDFPSVDYYPHDVHKLLLSNDILIIENLTNLQELIGYDNIEVLAFPLKVDGHGAPARVIAKTW